jgi:hypothetical protein
MTAHKSTNIGIQPPSHTADDPAIFTGDVDKNLDDGEVDEKGSSDTRPSHVQQIPFKYRAGALAFVIFITSGIEFAESILGPLKHTLVTELKVNSESSRRHERCLAMC